MSANSARGRHPVIPCRRSLMSLHPVSTAQVVRLRRFAGFMGDYVSRGAVVADRVNLWKRGRLFVQVISDGAAGTRSPPREFPTFRQDFADD
jgi:hypothetical protein